MAKKFKVGQQVKIRQWDDMKKEFGLEEDFEGISCKGYFAKSMKVFCGRKATILSISINDSVRLDFEDNSENPKSWVFTTDMIEPCSLNENSIPTFEDMVGKVVEVRNGIRYLGVKTEQDGIILVRKEGFISTEYRDEKLCSKLDKGYDIMKVYEPKYCGTFTSVLNSASTVIWERDEVKETEKEEVKEMTVADVEKLVGSRVKIVK